MATSFTMLEIMNAALISQGQDEIVAENDGSVEFRLLSRNWPTIVESQLEVGKFHFARKQHFLASRQPGQFGFEDSYLVPAETLHVRRLWYLDTEGRRFEPDWGQDGSAVHVNAEEGVYVEVAEATDASFWSANFAAGVQKALEAVIARAMREEYREAQALDMEAREKFEIAMTHSSQQRSAKPAYRLGPIASARFRYPRG